MIRAAVIIGRTTPIIRTRTLPSRQRLLSRLLRSLPIQGNRRAAQLLHRLRRQLRRKLRNYRLRVRHRSQLPRNRPSYRLPAQRLSRKPSSCRLRARHQGRIKIARSVSQEFPYPGRRSHNMAPRPCRVQAWIPINCTISFPVANLKNVLRMRGKNY